MKKTVTALTDFMMNKASMLSLPMSGTFELTPLCNFDCKMCYVRKSRAEVEQHSRPMMTLEQWLTIAEEAKKEGLLFLLLTGGEPLSWPYFWDLYEALIRMGLLVSINTNGSLITDDVIERFKKNPPKRINLTLYGASDETYERLCQVKGMFSRIETVVDQLISAGIIVKLNCSLTPHNVCDLEQMIDFAVKRELIIDVTTYMFPPMRRDESCIGENLHRFTPDESARYRLMAYRLTHTKEAYLQYLNNIINGFISPPGLDESCEDPIDGKIRCRAGKASFWITWDGWMTPCGMMTNPKVESVSKLFSETWDEINRISKDLKLSGSCTYCANQDLCHACAAMALTETGEFTGIPKYLCESALALKTQAQKELDSLKVEYNDKNL